MRGRDYSAIARYVMRRYHRMERRGVRLDALGYRFDVNNRIAYGIAAERGIDTEGMTPKEVWEAIGGRNAFSKGFKTKGGSGSRIGNMKSPVVRGMSRKEVGQVNRRLKSMTLSNYSKGREVANKENNTHLWTYTTHGEDHIKQVMEKTNQALDALEDMKGKSSLPIENVDRKLMMTAARFHDTGMDGGEKSYSGDGTELRKEHAVNSALHTLEHAKDIEKLGVNPSQAAFLVLAHTKSNSGIKDLSDPEDWKKGLDAMDKAVAEYNERHPKAKIEFKREDVFGGEPNKDNITMMRTAVAAIRIGDANRDADIPLRSQSGGEYKIEKMPPRSCTSVDEEAAKSVISITDKDGRHELSDSDKKMSKVEGRNYSKKVVLGERNMMNTNLRFNSKHNTLQEEFVLKNGNDVPHSTALALMERVGELNTITGVPRALKIKMTGVKNANSMTEQASRAYRQLWNDAKQMDDIVLEFDDGTKLSCKKAYKR